MDEKQKAASLSIYAGAFLTAGKLVVGISMNSISVISEAIHSGLDLIAALIAWSAVRLSGQPADERHHYGHGKFAILQPLLRPC